MEFPFESKHQADQRAAAQAAQVQRQAAAANPEEARAQALFVNTQRQPALAHRILPSPEDALAERLYGNAAAAKPNAQRETLDANDDHAVAARLYDSQVQYRESLPDRLVDEWGLIEAHQREAVLEELAELRELAGELQIGNSQVETLLGLQNQFDDVSQEQADAWRAETQQSLVREFGGTQASELLADARALVNQNPRLRAFLDDGARGNHPGVVRMFIDLARREKLAGRLNGGR
ncbi:MAG: hypothetical protein E6Q69_17025 [Aquipseudomonas alcaligenes]|uniref:Uncharacterized protein n=1 Tax=Aquipseudomonas alcaligenes TaxID=43263 RepID=A0A5C7VUD2_AQUAC|nr:MAG: hypothetical protein E6Q69_17025 [Pseudomonas alcaligenes]